MLSIRGHKFARVSVPRLLVLYRLWGMPGEGASGRVEAAVAAIAVRTLPLIRILAALRWPLLPTI